MKLRSIKIVLIACFISLYTYGQKQNESSDLDQSSFNSILDVLPHISKDSTKAEITTHVAAMIDWMKEEHYKTNYVSTLIYAENGLALAKRSNNEDHIHDVRAVLGTTLIRINDTVRAKNLFLKSLKEGKKTNDSSLILRAKGNLANVYYNIEGYKGKTIKIYLESIEIASRLKDTTRLFVLHHNLSRAYNETEDPANSAYHIKKTELYLNFLGRPPHYEASHLHNKGRQLLLLNEPDKAIENFKKTIDISESIDFVDALIEGYTGYKDALELKEDYKGVYELTKKLEVYEEKKDKEEVNNITEAVSAKLNVERFKDQIKSKELEKKLLVEQAGRKNSLLALVVGIGVFLMLILLISYFSHTRRKALVKDLQIKNKQYLEAKKQSDELTKAKSKFFATVSHELRTPLYGVIGLSSILLENNDLKKHEKDLKSLKFSADYLLALINDLLHMNKIDNDSFTEEENIFNLRELTTTIVSSFEYIRLQHQNDIRILIDKDSPKLLKGNSIRLSQILMNLIGNACKFTEKGSININIKTISQSDTNAKFQFIIEDTGPGIAECKLNQIFMEFTQIESSMSKYQGTGLGLPIVKKLVEKAGGIISVKSEIGKGTTFSFNLDLAISYEQEGQIVTPIQDLKQLVNKQILIVEDNRINQTVTKRILETEGVVCEIAKNGEEAVAMVKQKSYDLILMDINMPVKNGIDATKDIRVFNNFVPIIALTAVEIEEQKYQIFECGMNDIIVKPYDIDRFKKTIISNLSCKERDAFKKLA